MSSNIEEILQIDFVAYLEKNGFSVQGNPNPNWIKLTNSTTGENLRLVKKKTTKTGTTSYYQNNHIPNDRGNIINFVINRLNGGVIPCEHPSKEEFSKALSILEKEIGIFSKEKINQSQGENAFKKLTPEEETAKIKSINNKIAVLENAGEEQFKYLFKQRSILRTTLQRPELKGLLKAFPKELDNGHIIKNMAFAKRNLQGEIKGFAMHFYSSKEAKNQKINYQHAECGICRTEITPKSKGIIVGESIVDCISHLQLFQDKLDKSDKNFVYCAFEGNPNIYEYKEIYAVYKKIQENHPGEEIPFVSITDNDKVGYEYDLNFAVHFWNEEHPQQRISVSFLQDTKEILLPIPGIDIQKLNDTIVESIKTNGEDALLSRVKVVKEGQKVKIMLPVILDNKTYKCNFLSEIAKVIHQSNVVKFSQHKSILKDWNDELKQTVKKNNNLKVTI